MQVRRPARCWLFRYIASSTPSDTDVPQADLDSLARSSVYFGKAHDLDEKTFSPKSGSESYKASFFVVYNNIIGDKTAGRWVNKSEGSHGVVYRDATGSLSGTFVDLPQNIEVAWCQISQGGFQLESSATHNQDIAKVDAESQQSGNQA